ncbi:MULTISPECIES: acireductone synthase [Aphanothece]|uniref:acireductone synthase n=1 Tax=Aphanothece TaxID=1121 RepID=UPI00398F66F7
MGESSTPLGRSGVSHVLLDIEGTTCPVSFVADTLFPYAAARMASFLETEQNNPAVLQLLEQAAQAWEEDDEAAAAALRQKGGTAIGDYLQLLIRQDRKLPALKELQGLIWAQGYANGELRSPLFADVPSALERWHHQGLVLAVYSSGSVKAQQLLYGHSEAGDLRALFRFWFDTRTGPKQAAQSYRTIAAAMATSPPQVLFISDALAECQAAAAAGMHVLFSDREGNPARDPGSFARIADYSGLEIASPPAG